MNYWQLLGFIVVAMLIGYVKGKLTDSPDKPLADQHKD